MEKFKAVLELLDLLVKVGIAALALLLFGVQKEQVSLDKARSELAQQQQGTTLVVAEKIIALLFEEKNKCIAEDQAYMIDFLIETHNKYNAIHIDKDQFIRASSGRRACSAGAAAADTLAAAARNNGQVPMVTTTNVAEIARKAGLTLDKTKQAADTAFVAVGSFDAEKKSFRNFTMPETAVGADGSVKVGTVMRPKWSVYLRANTSNTTDNTNPVLGVLSENVCAQVVQALPQVRGQTWAQVQPVDCPR